ncbi:MAG: DEAD/DEAH box helicase, partial [Bacteroidetes bacterium]|nr:DEAD/DEAH box helicase [Bacteroidota bacterium]
MSLRNIYADVILPLSIPGLFTYSIPDDMQGLMCRGSRVLVIVGKKKIYTGIVQRVHENQPEGFVAKPIVSLLDKEPAVSDKSLDFWEWLAAYYMATPGEVMTAALPGGLKLSSETKFALCEDYEANVEQTSDEEFLVVDALELKKELTVQEIMDILGKKTVMPVIRSLEEKYIISIYEEVKEKFRPKLEFFVRFTDFADNEENLKNIFDELKRAPKQENLLMTYINLTNRYSDKKPHIAKNQLLSMGKCSSTILSAMTKKGIFESISAAQSRLQLSQLPVVPPTVLSEAQAESLGQIKEFFWKGKVTLLHGITSSGKTEIYVHLILEYLQLGKQILYLLPEIALTSQIIDRLTRFFGPSIAVYHSRLTNNERVEVWNAVLASNKGDGPVRIILGARSSVLLPYENLGLIIVDEEHEPAFKQYDPAPRYNARDAAIYLAGLHKANVLLGSATPSIESYFNAQAGKYGFVELTARFGKAILPEIQVV